MEWLEQNIDAYRIVSEILGQMRVAIRQQLEAIYGDNWYRQGLPEEVFDRLVSSKEREKSIDWYEGHYQQIMDYADFADLIEILEKNAEHFPGFMGLAPSSALLHARFLELDVMREKLGRARPISETELSFLGTFHLRFRKAAKEFGEMEAPPPVKPVAPVAEPEPRSSETAEVTKPAPTESEEKPQPEQEQDKEKSPEVPSSPPRRPAQGPKRMAKVQEEPTPEPHPEEDQEPEAPSEEPEAQDQPADHDEIDDASGDRAVGPRKLADALADDDHRTVLREIYREVTAIAEGVWTSDVTPAPLVWEQVTASEWYELNFSRLGLHPLSVFYEVTGKIEKQVREGATKAELQEFLKESNFAKTLLSLRDMFQNNNI